jgi:glucose/arabinose dehydrogenase
MRKVLWLLCACFVLLLLPFIAFPDRFLSPSFLRAPRRTPTPIVPATPDAAGKRITLPAGFRISIFVEGLVTPRLMTVGPDKMLYVSDMGAGRIVRLPDRNHDGRADSVEVAASGLSQPHGLEWRQGWLYVAELGKVERLRDVDRDGVLETKELVTDSVPGRGGHSTRTLHFWPGR